MFNKIRSKMLANSHKNDHDQVRSTPNQLIIMSKWSFRILPISYTAHILKTNQNHSCNIDKRKGAVLDPDFYDFYYLYEHFIDH